MPDLSSLLSQMTMEHGFAAICIILLAMLSWLIRSLLQILKDNGEIIAANSDAIRSLSDHIERNNKVSEEMRTELYRRPCILDLKVKKED